MVSSRRAGIVILGALGMAGLAGKAAAQTEPPNAESTTKVTITPNANVTKMSLNYFDHAWWFTPNPFKGKSDHTAGQAAGFLEFGYDSQKGTKIQNAGVPPNVKGAFPKGVNPIDVKPGTQPFTPNPNGGNAQNFSFQAQLDAPPNDHATAKSLFTISPFQANGKTFDASMTRKDYVDRNPLPQMSSYAFSYAGVALEGKGGTTTIGTVAANFRDSIGSLTSLASIERGLTINSMSFRIFDSSGDSKLFNSYYDSVAGTTGLATLNQDSTGYHLASSLLGGETALNIHVDGTYLSGTTSGDLNVDLANGLVTQQVATGLFSGVGFSYKLVGGVGSLDVTNLPSLLFQLNIPDAGDPSTSFLLKVDASTSEAASVCEPSSLLMGGTSALAALAYAWRRRRLLKLGTLR
jgi:hypothetical protein